MISSNVSRIIQSIEKSNRDITQSYLHYLCGSSDTTNTDSLQNTINQTLWNPGPTANTTPNNKQYTKIKRLVKMMVYGLIIGIAIYTPYLYHLYFPKIKLF